MPDNKQEMVADTKKMVGKTEEKGLRLPVSLTKPKPSGSTGQDQTPKTPEK